MKRILLMAIFFTLSIWRNTNWVYAQSSAIAVNITKQMTEASSTSNQSLLVVSPTKMNVLYIGVPNPIEIEVADIPKDKIQVSISNGAIMNAGKAGSYIAQVKSVGRVNINITANINGRTMNLGSKEFRVKKIPDPIAYIANKRGGTIDKSELLKQEGIKAVFDNFDFDMRFNVISFKVSASIKGFSREATASSASFTPEQKAIIEQVKSDDKVYFEDIKAKGPDGSIRSLGSITFKIK